MMRERFVNESEFVLSRECHSHSSIPSVEVVPIKKVRNNNHAWVISISKNIRTRRIIHGRCWAAIRCSGRSTGGATTTSHQMRRSSDTISIEMTKWRRKGKSLFRIFEYESKIQSIYDWENKKEAPAQLLYNQKWKAKAKQLNKHLSS